jgi:hypothetical protein
VVGVGEGVKAIIPCFLLHNAHFRDKRCQKRRQRVPKTAPLAGVDHVTVSRFFLAVKQNGKVELINRL